MLSALYFVRAEKRITAGRANHRSMLSLTLPLKVIPKRVNISLKKQAVYRCTSIVFLKIISSQVIIYSWLQLLGGSALFLPITSLFTLERSPSKSFWWSNERLCCLRSSVNIIHCFLRGSRCEVEHLNFCFPLSKAFFWLYNQYKI